MLASSYLLCEVQVTEGDIVHITGENPGRQRVLVAAEDLPFTELGQTGTRHVAVAGHDQGRIVVATGTQHVEQVIVARLDAPDQGIRGGIRIQRREVRVAQERHRAAPGGHPSFAVMQRHD